MGYIQSLLILSRPLYELYTISIDIIRYIQSLLILSRPLYELYTISIDIIQTSVSELQSHLMFWEHPSLPSLSPFVSNDSRQRASLVALRETAFIDALKEDWSVLYAVCHCSNGVCVLINVSMINPSVTESLDLVSCQECVTPLLERD